MLFSSWHIENFNLLTLNVTLNVGKPTSDGLLNTGTSTSTMTNAISYENYGYIPSTSAAPIAVTLFGNGTTQALSGNIYTGWTSEVHVCGITICDTPNPINKTIVCNSVLPIFPKNLPYDFFSNKDRIINAVVSYYLTDNPMYPLNHTMSGEWYSVEDSVYNIGFHDTFPNFY